MAGGAHPRQADGHLSIVGGQREAVALWMLPHLGDVVELPGGYEAIGVARGGRLVGGCLYSNYVPCHGGGGNIQIWAVGETGWVSRRVIRVMLGYPFDQLQCHRITALAKKSNRASRALLEGLGFVVEGKIRRGFDMRNDMMVYGLLRAECRWI